MTISSYSSFKDMFVEGDCFDFIALDNSVYSYKKLLSSLKKPIKLILFYGKPGTGKSFLLKKVYVDNKNKDDLPLVLFLQPFFSESEFYKALYERIFAEKSPESFSYDTFLKVYSSKFLNQDNIPIVSVLLDEAQLYPSDLIEKIRLLADTRLFKFVFTVHKTEKEDVLAKDYFKTRIWEVIELSNCNFNEMNIYLEKKFISNNVLDVFSMFSNKRLKIIFSITDGNLRTINKLMYKIFEICDFYLAHNTNELKMPISRKIIEMAAIDLGILK